ncbi:cytochrome c-type biogenesis protein CcmH [Acanthopleuribacter pedis]|uniref:Cytochrome c-type biogenesis protein n=1 Tax=Acanthopleuribacter pedis TaxID=442870 RepID=A0A8J7QJZ0_9BACT|nr:cytochrome c-type biogenesis protein CcmH [Acanthopleuribacter pedis]MBO1322301.1 cytochrome c-type biogenesis protein CcmH [Acanthopleuribacter pedis]
MRGLIGCLLLMGFAVYGQQLVVPKELDAKQAKLYEKVAISVVAPCCKNMIPVAFHESPMAQDVLAEIKSGVVGGKSEAEIHQLLRDMRFEGNEEARVIFAIPDKNWLGMLAWMAPFGFIFLMCCVMGYILMGTRRPKKQESLDLDSVRERVMKDMH